MELSLPPIILASSSVYRRHVLERLGLQFECRAPEIDETPRAKESPESLVVRLAEQKAQAIAANLDRGLVIGADQVSVQSGEILGKPADYDDAVAQLQRASGQSATLFCGVAVVNVKKGTCQSHLETVSVKCRQLKDAMKFSGTLIAINHLTVAAA